MKKRKTSSFSRRDVMRFAVAGFGAVYIGGCNNRIDLSAFLQKRFREMSPDEVLKLIQRLENNYSKQYGRPFRVTATPPIDNTLFGFGLDLSKCIGCRKCVHACVRENNISRDVEIHYIRVIRMKEGESALEKGEHYYETDQVPEKGFLEMQKAGAIVPVAPERFGEQFMQLVNSDLYHEKSGLNWDNPWFIEAENLAL